MKHDAAGSALTPFHRNGRDAEALIFDIQRFSLHDGPGVRTTVFFKGCSLACRWCQNPESHRLLPEMAFYTHKCLGCFQCEQVCPLGAIVRGGPTRVDFTRCDACGRCAEACSAGALRTIGARWSVQALADELLRDQDFFTGGGGVTLSGGEPMLHADYIVRLVGLLKSRGVHVVMETAGHVSPADFDRVAGLVDLFYFDLKLADAARHRLFTGATNELLLKNFHGLVRGGCAVQPRMPVVPGINDDEENIRATARIIRDAGLSSIHCLPWHGMGDAKLARIDAPRERVDAVAPGPDLMEAVKRIFAREGIDAVIYQ